jgi:hypothetical protein
VQLFPRIEPSQTKIICFQRNGRRPSRLSSGRDVKLDGGSTEVVAAAPEHRQDGGSVRRSNPGARAFHGSVSGRSAQAVKTGNTNRGGRFSTVDLLIKVACCVRKVYNIFNKK